MSKRLVCRFIQSSFILISLYVCASNAIAFDTETEDPTESIEVQGQRPDMWDMIDEMFNAQMQHILAAFDTWHDNNINATPQQFSIIVDATLTSLEEIEEDREEVIKRVCDKEGEDVEDSCFQEMASTNQNIDYGCSALGGAVGGGLGSLAAPTIVGVGLAAAIGVSTYEVCEDGLQQFLNTNNPTNVCVSSGRLATVICLNRQI